jgi:MarR family transcriptional regulator, organic hydroperoxide resistance regulator
MSDDHLKLSNQFCHKLYMATNAVIRAYRPILEELDLTYPQYLTMLALWEQDNQEINQVLAKTLIDAGAFSLILKKLQAKNLLQVITSEKDRRVRQITLTKKGRTLKQQAVNVPSQMICKLPSLSREDTEALARITRAIVDDLSW